MDFGKFSFGSIEIDGEAYDHDVVIDRGRFANARRKLRGNSASEFGHTPLSLEEKIPWKCRRLIVGSGKYAALPVMDEVKLEAGRRDVDITILPTAQRSGSLARIRRRRMRSST